MCLIPSLTAGDDAEGQRTFSPHTNDTVAAAAAAASMLPCLTYTLGCCCLPQLPVYHPHGSVDRPLSGAAEDAECEVWQQPQQLLYLRPDYVVPDNVPGQQEQ